MKLRARSVMSVAITCPECREARIAWIPAPVPMSSALSTGRRTVRCEIVTDGLWTPATWSGRLASRTPVRSEVTRTSPCGTICAQAQTPPPPESSSPSACTRSIESGASARRASASGTGTPSTKSAVSVPNVSSSASRRFSSGISPGRARIGPSTPNALRTAFPSNPAATSTSRSSAIGAGSSSFSGPSKLVRAASTARL